MLSTFFLSLCSSESESNATRDDYNFVLSASCVDSTGDQSSQEMTISDILDRYVEASRNEFIREEACVCCNKKKQLTTMYTKILDL